MRDSSNYEAGLVKSESGNGLTDSQAARQERVRNSEYETGLYLILPQRNFNVDTKFGEETFSSPRHVIVKIDKKKPQYARTWKCSNYTAQMTRTKEDGVPSIKAVKNSDGLWRLPQGTGAVLACRDFIPKAVVEDKNGDKRLVIKTPTMINFVGTVQGFTPSYSRNNKGAYDIDRNEEGEVTFNSTSIPQFNVLKDEVSDELVAAAKDVISKDSQLSSLVDLL